MFADEFIARSGRPPGEYAIFGYEAMRVVLDWITEADDGAALRRRVIDAFIAIRDRDSVLGSYSIYRHGDSTLSTDGVWRIAANGTGLVYDSSLGAASPPTHAAERGRRLSPLESALANGQEDPRGQRPFGRLSRRRGRGDRTRRSLLR